MAKPIISSIWPLKTQKKYQPDTLSGINRRPLDNNNVGRGTYPPHTPYTRAQCWVTHALLGADKDSHSVDWVSTTALETKHPPVIPMFIMDFPFYVTGNVLAGADTICSGQVFRLTYLIFIKQFETEFQWRSQLTMIRQRKQITSASPDK